MPTTSNGKTTVSLNKCPDYKDENVQRAVDESLAALGGIESVVKSGQRVLIKPNLLFGKAPDKAMNTHYAVVKAVMARVADCGGNMFMGDSPSFGSAEGAAKKCGILDVAKSFGVEVVTFKESRKVPPADGRIYHDLPLSVDALDADVVISIPKMKTHAMMTMTLGVKNLFGCVVGMAKSQWHLKAGQDLGAFARMLVEINDIVAPSLTVMDGIVGMDGNGPGSGDPKFIGLVSASRDAVAMDRVLMDVINSDDSRLPVIEAARRLGRGTTELSKIDIVGDSPRSIGVKSFNFPPPPTPDLNFLPKFVRQGIKRALTNEPYVHNDRCTRCGTCVKACPPQVMSFQPLGKADKSGSDKFVRINRNGCIHCFCCQEVCPEGAITVRKGIFAGR